MRKNLKYKVILSSILFALSLIGAILILFYLPAKQIIIFYGDSCSHCASLEEYLTQNKASEKINFVRKEVSNSPENSQQLADLAKVCNLPTDNIALPFVWDGNNCYQGEQSALDFFKKKISD